MNANIEHKAIDVGAAIDDLGATALRIKQERDALADALRDIAEYDCPGLAKHCPGCAACDARAALAKAGL